MLRLWRGQWKTVSGVYSVLLKTVYSVLHILYCGFMCVRDGSDRVAMSLFPLT